jgi:cellulose synthase/poly-beta-1,6-N-acetylglucosamine synthase-like glycosyltransferase
MKSFSFVIPFPNNTDYWFGGISLLFMAVSWYYYFRFYVKVKRTKLDTPYNLPPVSVVIAARNEINNLKAFLPLWLEQDYPEFEIVITDDGSTDGTAEWIAPLVNENNRLKFVHLDAAYVKMHGKKIALTLGFKAAKYGHFLLTDADCKPAGNQWIKHMAAPFSGGAEVVLGYSPLHAGNGFLGRLIRYETLLTAMNYMGFAIAGQPYMGVGRNLAYSRRIHNSVNGFSAHYYLPAGDDDLFVQSVATAQNTAVVIHPEALTWSKAKSTWSDYIRQRIRHLWIGKYYDSGVKRKLGLFSMVQLLFWFAILPWFFMTSSPLYPFGILLLKLLPEWIIFYGRSRSLKIKGVAGFYPFWSFFHPFWYTFIGIRAFFAKKPVW